MPISSVHENHLDGTLARPGVCLSADQKNTGHISAATSMCPATAPWTLGLRQSCQPLQLDFLHKAARVLESLKGPPFLCAASTLAGGRTNLEWSAARQDVLLLVAHIRLTPPCIAWISPSFDEIATLLSFQVLHAISAPKGHASQPANLPSTRPSADFHLLDPPRESVVSCRRPRLLDAVLHLLAANSHPGRSEAKCAWHTTRVRTELPAPRARPQELLDNDSLPSSYNLLAGVEDQCGSPTQWARQFPPHAVQVLVCFLFLLELS